MNAQATSGEEQARRMLFDFFIHEAENLHNRVDWFLIFHAILFEAFFNATHNYVAEITVGFLGCVVSFVWLVAGIRQLWNITCLSLSISDEKLMGKDAADLFDRMYKARRTYQPDWMKSFSSNPAFSAILPFTILIVWTILIFTRASNHWICISLALLATLALTTVIWNAIQNLPKVSGQTLEYLRTKPTTE